MARQFLDEASQIRKLLDHKIAQGVPLEHIPPLWYRLGGYALALVHTRLNEGQHRTVNLESRVSISHISLMFANFKLRKPEILKDTRGPHFMQLSEAF